MYTYYVKTKDGELYHSSLYHHGVLGMKWGIRRYQNPDGSLTNAGKRHYRANSINEIRSRKGISKRLNDLEEAKANLQWKDRYDYGNSKVRKHKKDRALKSEKNLKKQFGIGNAEIDKLLKLAKKNGYNITTKDRSKMVIPKRRFRSDLLLPVLLGGVPGYTIETIRAAGDPKNTIKYKRYKLYKD